METLSDRTAQLGSEHTPGWSGASLAANNFFLGYRLYCIETCGSRVRIPTITSDFQDIEAPIPMGWCVSRTLENVTQPYTREDICGDYMLDDDM